METLLSEVDRRAVTNALGEFLVREGTHALTPGMWGWYDDDIAFTRPWGFDLGAIRVPVSIWQGRQDNMVPFAHGEWLAAHIPGATKHFHEDEGHLSLEENNFGTILDQMCEVSRV
jgi:pimeloyl-ACP methyl ester carboxylesterase